MDLRLHKGFYLRDVLEVAPDLLGKILVRDFGNGDLQKFIITDVEAYRGVEDLACHASKGRTARTRIMFDEGGIIYVYFIYGMYWMLNVVTGARNDASAVLIRGFKGISGPGRVGRVLRLDRSFYGENLTMSDRIRIEEGITTPAYHSTTRIGIGYAGEPWVSKPWHFIMK